MVNTALDPCFSAAAGRAASSAIRDILVVAEREDVISLAGGLPAAEMFPTSRIAAALADALAEDGPAALQYSRTEGYGPLRHWVADRHHAHPDQVLITAGSQQALDLVARAMVDPGVAVALADPGYVGAIQAFRLAGGRLVGVPSDDDGILVDALAGVVTGPTPPALVYVVPSFHNPSGATLAAERCHALATLAERHGLWIVADDPYQELRWHGLPPPPLATLSERVLTVGSFSKVLCPGLRVGYVVAPVPIVRTMALLKQAADLHTATLSQRVVCRLVTTPGFLASHVARLRLHYQAKAAALAEALHDQLGGELEFRHADGGMFVWARMHDRDIDTATLLTAAVERGMAFVPGAAFAVENHFARHLRLSFATATVDELPVAVSRLAAALASLGGDAQRLAADRARAGA